MNTLNEKIAESKEVLKNVLSQYDGMITIAWTGGKDSISTLHLIKEKSASDIENCF